MCRVITGKGATEPPHPIVLSWKLGMLGWGGKTDAKATGRQKERCLRAHGA